MKELNAEQPDEVARLIAILKREAKSRWRRSCRLLLVLGVLALLVSNTVNPCSAYVFLWLGFIVLGYRMAQWERTPRAKRALTALTDKEDVRIIAPLIEAYSEDKEDAVHEAVIAALIRLLPALKEKDADKLDSANRFILQSALKKHSQSGLNTDFVIAILKSMENVGTKQEIPVIAKLAMGRGLAKADARIQPAAQECLIHLRERVEGQRSDQILLRAPNEPASNTLLRPTESTPDIQQDTLLRAAVQEHYGQERKTNALQQEERH